MIYHHQTQVNSLNEAPIFSAVAEDHRRQAENARNSRDRARHARLAMQWEKRADAARWVRL